MTATAESSSMETIMARNNTTTTRSTWAADKPATVSRPVDGRKRNPTTAATAAAVAMALCVCLLLSSASAASVHKRAVVDTSVVIENHTNTSAPVKVCHLNTPCGWAIYIPFIRRIDYFMKNTCECGPLMACLKTDDDLSVNAYVYRCKPRPVAATTDATPPPPTTTAI